MTNKGQFSGDPSNFLVSFRCFTGFPAHLYSSLHGVRRHKRVSKTCKEPIVDKGDETLILLSHHMPLRLHTSPKVHQTRLQHATWLGNTTVLLMISENDIYLRTTPSATEDTRLTDTGIPGVVYNGVPDWLYQEEVLPRPEAIWSSPDGSHILFASFNDTRVTELEFPWFGTQMGQNGFGGIPTVATKRGTFPPSRTIRYPTPGSPNPEVDLWLIDLNNNTNFSNVTNTTQPFRTRLKPPTALDGQ